MLTSADATNRKTLIVGAAVDTIVTVKVGPDRVKFCVHKALLIHHSEYFRKALAGQWKEAAEQLVTLDDIEPPIFTVFVHWLYTQQILKKEDYKWEGLDMPDIDGKSPAHEADLALVLCVKGYVLGDRLLAPKFCRAMNNAFVTEHKDCNLVDRSGCVAISYAFAELPAKSVILQCLVDGYCLGFDAIPETVMEQFRDLPRAFLQRTIHRLHGLKRMSRKDRKVERCYLEHASDEELVQCKALHMRYDTKTELAHFE